MTQGPNIDPNESTWKFIVTVKPRIESGEVKSAQQETQSFREMMTNAGPLSFSPREIGKLKKQNVIPQHLTNEQAQNVLDTAKNAYLLGIDGFNLEKAGERAGQLLPQEREFVKITSDVVSRLQAGDTFRAQALHASAGFPGIEEITVERAYSSQTAPGPNQLLFATTGDTVHPILQQAGSMITGKVKGKVVSAAKNYVTKTLAKSAAWKATKEIISDVAGVAGAEFGGPLVKWAVQAALTLAEKTIGAVSKFVRDNKEVFAGIALGMLGLGALIGAPLLMLGGGLILGTMLLAGGVPLVTTGFGGAVAGTMAFMFFISPVAQIGAFLAWLIFWVIISIILVLFIIQVGGYVVPYWNQTINNPATPFEQQWNVSTENQYIGVGKLVKNAPQNPGVVTYTITIEAKLEDLTAAQIKSYVCQIIKKAGNGDCTSTEPDWSKVAPELNDPTFVIKAGTSYQFEFTANYGASGYTDSLVVDTIEICANTQSQGQQCSTSSASVCFGDCPNECYKLDGSWSGSNKSDIEQAIAILTSQYAAFTQKVCAGFPNGINLHMAGANDNYWGFYSNAGGGSANVSIYQLGFSNDPSINDTVYILAHESGHALSDGMPSIWQEYLSWPGIASEVPYCFYSYGSDINERFAEAIAYYTIYKSWRCSNFPTSYPNHFNFVDQKVFK